MFTSLSNTSKRIKSSLIISATLLVLSACESDEVSEELRIAELKPINIQRNVNVEWREHVGDGVKNYYSNLKPAVSKQRVFVASREGEVEAFSAEDGKDIWQMDVREDNRTLWQKITGNELSSAKLSGGITAAYGNLYIGTEEGEVIAISQETGETLWRQEAKGEVIAAPGAGEGWIAVTTTSGHITTMHPDTGEIRWQLESDVPALTLRGTSSPTIANGGVVYGAATGKLQIIILEKGIPAWDVAVGKVEGATELERLIDVDSKPLVSGTTVYAIGYNGNLISVDLMSGQVNWKREYSSYRNLTLENNVLYLTDAKGVVTAVDAFSGAEKWSTSEFYNRRLTTPVIYKDTIVVGDYEGYFHFLDKTGGKVVSRYKYDDIDYSFVNWFVSWFTSENRIAYTAPVVSGDLLYIQTRDGEVAAVSLSEEETK